MIEIDDVVLDPYSSDGWVKTQTLEAVLGTVDSGAATAIARWQDFQRTYDVPFENMDLAERTAFLNFHQLRDGMVRGFLVWDLYECYAELQPIGTGDGATAVYQLTTTIADTARSRVRKILRPVPTGRTLPDNVQQWLPGTTTAYVMVWVDNVAKTEGVDFTVNYATGAITFASGHIPPAGKAIVATFWYYTPVRFTAKDMKATSKGILASATSTMVEIIAQ